MPLSHMNVPTMGSRSYILVLRNALHVPSMKNNLIPPFVMREAGIKVNDTPKIQTSNPTEEDHSIYFPDNDVGSFLLFQYVETVD